MRLLFLLQILTILGCSQGLKILGVFPISAHSHYAPAKTLMNSLVDKGHDVTVIAPFVDGSAKFKTIQLTGLKEAMEDMSKKINLYDRINHAWWERIVFLHFMGSQISEDTLEHPNVEALLNSKETFDVVVVEQFLDESLRGFCHRYSAACVVFSSLPALHWTNAYVGNPDNPSYIPQITLGDPGDMNFCKRLQNTLLSAATYVFYYGIYLLHQDGIMQEHFPGAPSLLDIYHDVDVVLINSYPGYTDPIPHVPNMIEIGGFHIEPPKKLPADLQKYLDEAKEGVILFSMGSVMKGTDMSKETMEIILKSFSKLNVKVLWKLEFDRAEKPANVKIVKWLPQQDVLAHPNVKAFFTHAGLHSTIEAVHFGVPVIGMPIFGDQESNFARLIKSGMGVKVSYLNLTEEALDAALKEILENPQYKSVARQLSDVVRDLPMPQVDKAVFWIEYAHRHKGSNHLKSGIIHLAWYQYLLLDVIAFLLVVLILSFVVLRMVWRRFIKPCVFPVTIKKTVVAKENKAKKNN